MPSHCLIGVMSVLALGWWEDKGLTANDQPPPLDRISSYGVLEKTKVCLLHSLSLSLFCWLLLLCFSSFGAVFIRLSVTVVCLPIGGFYSLAPWIDEWGSIQVKVLGWRYQGPMALCQSCVDMCSILFSHLTTPGAVGFRVHPSKCSCIA